MEDKTTVSHGGNRRRSFPERLEKNLIAEILKFLRFLKVLTKLVYRAVYAFLKNLIKAASLIVTGMFAYIFTLFGYDWFQKVFVFSIVFAFVYFFVTSVI